MDYTTYPTVKINLLNIAHRGALSLAPENTLAAAQKALEIGADMWELDVTMTLDGELILVHDDTLERTSNVKDIFSKRQPWQVQTFTLAEIRRLDFGSWFNHRDPFGQIAAGNVPSVDLEHYVGEPAPTLGEALAFTHDNDWRVNVEIRHSPVGGAKIVEKVVTLIEAMNMMDRVIISSFNHDYLTRVKAANPKIATGVLDEIVRNNLPGFLRRLDAQAYHPRASAIQPEAIVDLREQGFEVNVWTVNDEEMMYSLIEAGASGIITDFPQRLSRLLKGRQ